MFPHRGSDQDLDEKESRDDRRTQYRGITCELLPYSDAHLLIQDGTRWRRWRSVHELAREHGYRDRENRSGGRQAGSNEA